MWNRKSCDCVFCHWCTMGLKVGKVAERKLPDSKGLILCSEFSSQVVLQKRSEFSEVFEDSWCFVSWEVETTENSAEIAAIFTAKSQSKSQEKNHKDFLESRQGEILWRFKIITVASLRFGHLDSVIRLGLWRSAAITLKQNSCMQQMTSIVSKQQIKSRIAKENRPSTSSFQQPEYEFLYKQSMFSRNSICRTAVSQRSAWYD